MALRRLILGLIILRDVEDPELYFFTISATLNRAKDLIYITNVRLYFPSTSLSTLLKHPVSAHIGGLNCHMALLRCVGEE